MNSSIIEGILIGLIIITQVYIFFETFLKIKAYKNIIPEIRLFRTINIRLSNKEISYISQNHIFDNLDQYEVTFESGPKGKNSTDIMLLYCNTDQPGAIRVILGAINTYLIRNKGAVSDFNLIKDVVERNTDASDEEINTLLPIPLYLGLMGTMLGIIVGLWSIDIGSETLNINNLITGVSIAMIASLVGLLFTTYNSGWFYKGAKSGVEQRKNELYTLIQVEMLPVLTADATSAIRALQQNLAGFNNDFSANMGDFRGVMGQILNSFDSQVEMMKLLKEVDMVQMSKLNIEVMRELRVSAREFEKFNEYLTKVNDFVEHADQLSLHINEQLNCTDDIRAIAKTITQNIEINNRAITVLEHEYSQIEDRKQYISRAVSTVDETLMQTFSSLQTTVEEKIKAIKEIVIKETDLVNAFVTELLQKDASNLDGLRNIGPMRTSLDAMVGEDKAHNEAISQLMARQDARIEAVVEQVSTLVKAIDTRDKQKSRSMVTTKIALYVCAGCVVLFFAYLMYEKQTQNDADHNLIEYFKQKDEASKAQ